MVRLIDLQTIPNPADGLLVVMESGKQVPFEMRRVFLLSEVPQGTTRGNHAHRRQHQFFIMVQGTISVTTLDRDGEQRFVLDDPGVGLHAPPLTWVNLRTTSARSSCLVLTSALYDAADYIHDRAEFDRLIRP